MSVMSEKHQKLTDGVGACSVPMWMGGMPAGFCDKPAYGKPEPNNKRYGDWNHGRWQGCYVPALACYGHGGPKAPVPVTSSN